MKPKLIIIINRLVIGGQALDTIPLAYYLKDDFDILILCGEKEKDEEEAFFLLDKYPGLIIKKISRLKRRINPVQDFLAFLQVRREIKKFECSIIHTHGAKSGLLGRIAAKLLGVKQIIHTFHGNHFHSYYGSFLSRLLVVYERWIGRLTTKIIAISSEQKEELVYKYKIVPENKIALIHLGVDANLLSSNSVVQREMFRKQYSLGADTVAIGIIGRIVPVKNFSLFINIAAKLLTASKTMLRFFIIGDGVLKKQLETHCDKLGIEWCSADNFKPASPLVFTSWIPEIATAFHGLDIVALTSHNEGTPLSLIEAQVCGKPVVAMDAGGVRDTLINNETGFLVIPSDETQFAEKLSLLIDNTVLRESMGKNGAVFAKKEFSKNAEVEAFKTLYQNCVNKK